MDLPKEWVAQTKRSWITCGYGKARGFSSTHSQKKRKNPLVRRMVFDVSTQSRRSESHRLTSGQHRTQWSMFKLLLSLSHTYSDSPTYTNTHNSNESCRIEHSVPKEWFIVKSWKLPKQLQSGCSTGQREMVKYVSAHIFLPKALPTSKKPFQINQLINSPKMTQDGSLGGVKNTFLPVASAV